MDEKSTKWNIHIQYIAFHVAGREFFSQLSSLFYSGQVVLIYHSLK